MGIEEFLLDRAKREGVQQGLEQGIEQGKRLFVNRLLQKTNFSDEQIADMADVPVALVRQLRNALPAKP